MLVGEPATCVRDGDPGGYSAGHCRPSRTLALKYSIGASETTRCRRWKLGFSDSLHPLQERRTEYFQVRCETTLAAAILVLVSCSIIFQARRRPRGGRTAIGATGDASGVPHPEVDAERKVETYFGQPYVTPERGHWSLVDVLEGLVGDWRTLIAFRAELQLLGRPSGVGSSAAVGAVDNSG